MQPDESDLPALKTALEKCTERAKPAREVGMIAGESWLSDCGDFQFALATGFLMLSAYPDAQVGVCTILAILGKIHQKNLILENLHFTCWDLNVRYFHYL